MWMKAWPVDFSGFTDSGAIIARIDELRPQVMRGSVDLCWAAWEIEELEQMLRADDPVNQSKESHNADHG